MILASNFKQVRKLKRKQASGFSLIELMIVIAIVGILSTIAIPSYQKYIKKTKMSEVIALLGQFSQNAVIGYMKTNSFPTSIVANGLILNDGDKVSTNNAGKSIVTLNYQRCNPGTGGTACKAIVEAQVTPELGGSLVMITLVPSNDGAIQPHCGMWLPYNAETLSYLPSTCQNTNLSGL